MDPDSVPEIDIATQELLLAAAHHDVPRLRALLRNSSANVKDSETGYSPLHSAIAASNPTADGNVNGDGPHLESGEGQEGDVELDAAERTLKLLFQNGAIWNDLDANNETPGCLAWRLGLKSLYEIVVDAGVRAELLLSRLDEYNLLGDEQDEGDEDEDVQDESMADGGSSVVPAADTIQVASSNEVSAGGPITTEDGNDQSTLSANYLSSDLEFRDDRLLDASHNGVMMRWETMIMQRSTELLLPSSLPPSSASILNIGHGMGIIDAIISEKSPSSHHIIEAHPQVLAHMQQQGWNSKQNTTIHDGKWQEVLPQLVAQGVTFDAIYFDTFAEDYNAFKEFFSEHVIGLLKPDGVWSFFNGLGADRQVCYDVYRKVLEMDLFEAGFDIEWEKIDTKDIASNAAGEGEWQGVRRRYWVLESYLLPLCRFVG